MAGLVLDAIFPLECLSNMAVMDEIVSQRVELFCALCALCAQLLSFFEERKFISRIFSQHRLLGEKGKDIWIYEDKKTHRTLI